MFIFKDSIGHVVILSDNFFVYAALAFLIILEFDVAADSMFLQIYQILFTAVVAIGSNHFSCIWEYALMLFQNWDQCVVIRLVTAHITVDNEVILYCDLDIVGWF
ncbi:MAG: hypothetical protein HFG39_08205 [Lachnospiraceae bacterium]|nr:hypothetical protein [Lachnospiraceae bacterium]